MLSPTLLCTYLDLLSTLAALDRNVDPTGDMDACLEFADYAVVFTRPAPNLDVDLYAGLCGEHADATEGMPGRRDKANRLSPPKPNPS